MYWFEVTVRPAAISSLSCRALVLSAPDLIFTSPMPTGMGLAPDRRQPPKVPAQPRGCAFGGAQRRCAKARLTLRARSRSLMKCPG